MLAIGIVPMLQMYSFDDRTFSSFYFQNYFEKGLYYHYIGWLKVTYSDRFSILYSQEKIRKRRLFKKVLAFCEEKILRCLLGIFWYAESKNQGWQAEKWRPHYLICIFPRWPPN